MITSVFIIAISVILFVYWLRYSCLLLLRSAQELGLIRPDADLDLVMEMLIGSFIARHLSGRKRPARWAERAVATVWQGLEIRG